VQWVIRLIHLDVAAYAARDGYLFEYLAASRDLLRQEILAGRKVRDLLPGLLFGEYPISYGINEALALGLLFAYLRHEPCLLGSRLVHIRLRCHYGSLDSSWVAYEVE
jgi:hypothetical protein